MTKRATFRIFAALAAIIVASPARAEIADKMPSISFMWVWAIGLVAIAIVLEKVRSLLGLAVVPFGAFLLWGAHSEMADPHFGPVVLAELGSDYVTHSYASAWAGILGPVVIVLLRQVYRRRSKS